MIREASKVDGLQVSLATVKLSLILLHRVNIIRQFASKDPIVWTDHVDSVLQHSPWRHRAETRNLTSN